MSEEIIITVDDDANVSVEAKGFKGKGCQAATEAIEKALGKTTKDTKKPDFYSGAEQGARVQQ